MNRPEKRKTERYRCRVSLQYENIFEDGRLGLPITAVARDISAEGISFYVPEKMNLHSNVRITFFLLEGEKISFTGVIVRMEIIEDDLYKYLIGMKIENSDEEMRIKISKFIDRVNLCKVLDKINLADVVDVHFVAGCRPILKKLGGLEFSGEEILDEYVLNNLLINILDDGRYKKFLKEKESNFIFLYKKDIRFRVNLHFQLGKIEGAFRLISNERQLPHQLGLPEVIEKLLITHKKGLFLVAGRTGSGKTTTLASMVELLNHKREVIIISIEDPVEYIHTPMRSIIKQREVGRDTLSFSNAAKNALRQNPDVLVIGEILDKETMDVAITASETGMLVLTSIHAADSAQALDRVTSFFPPELHGHVLSRLALILRGVITQDLIPRRDGKGLVVAAEILIMNDAMRRVIRQGEWKNIPMVIESGRKIGMQSMCDALMQYYRDDVIDEEYLKEYL